MEQRRGLDAYGYFEREGSLGRIQPAFADLVAAARSRIAEAYGAGSTAPTSTGPCRAAPPAPAAPTSTC
ncbi:hypothetical protein SLAVM298S_06428 [Streptomyces lavendulae subsp. lavendulae]